MNTWRFGTTGASLVLALTALGCGGREDTAADIDTGAAAAMPSTTDTAGGAVAGATSVSVADIVGSPERYLGQTVTVEADVEEVLSPFAFSLDEDAPAAGGIDNDLMVFSPKSAQLANIDDQWLNNRVRVTGVVRRMTIVEIEREIEWDLDAKIEAELESTEPVLIATSVQRIGAGR